MRTAKAFLHYLRYFEQSLCFLAFLWMAVQLIGDVLSREFTGSGWFGAPQRGVVGMIIVAYMGVALASANGSHFRPKFADIVLRRWDSLANRIGEFGFAIFCAFMSYIAFGENNTYYNILIFDPSKKVRIGCFIMVKNFHTCI